MKNVKCLLLKSNQVVVSEVEEISAELGEPDCKLIKPFLLNTSTFELTEWLIFTDQTEMMIRSDDVLTFVDPNSEVLKNYLDLK